MAAMVRSGPLCVICGKRPAYNDGRRSFNTCSKTCGTQLKILQGLPDQSGSSRPTNSMVNLHHRATPTTVRMCVVCHTRRQCVRGGVVYPTCGLTCASKLAGSQGIEMCTFCHQRPKAIRNGKTYPQCGKTCRDKAQAAVTNVAACATCVLCWKKFKFGNSDFCTVECVENAERRSPVLLEIPKGHVSFKKVADCFSRAWKDTRRPSPTVKRIYMVSIKKSAKNNYELYRNKVGQHGSFQKKGNELLSWLGIPRDCGFGDPGKMEPCASSKCLMCCIVRSNVTRIEYPDGIMSTPLPRAVEMVGTPARRSSKVVLLANILMGRQVEMDSRHVAEYTPPPGIDSVSGITVPQLDVLVDIFVQIRLVSITHLRKIEYGEVVVYHGDAVKPLYMIAYE
ncbi:hypothetical protein BJ165DRAFT_699514 [Panaeolus papilionaceus]|nr:hypothetical protein BJ165DRAFT_699514 [Panaeolus papilionaceus]